MRARYLTQLFAGALGSVLVAGISSPARAQGSSATAQATTAPRRVRVPRAALRARLAQMTRAERTLARAKVRHHVRQRVRNMSPEQKQWAQLARTEAKTLHAGVKAGTLTRESAAAQRKEWRSANPRPRKGTR